MYNKNMFQFWNEHVDDAKQVCELIEKGLLPYEERERIFGE